VLVKCGVHATEMNRFRYDVVLRVGSGPVQDNGFACDVDWERERLNLAELRSRLREKPEKLRVTRVPNRRVANDARALTLLRENEGLATVGDLRQALQQTKEKGVDPEEFWSLDSAYTVQVQLSAECGDCCDAVLTRRARGVAEESPGPTPLWQTTANRPWTAYANNPLRGALTLNLAPELRKYLHELVPEYMVPAAFVMLEALPLTPNGKINRRALPVPDDARPELQQTYVEPSSLLERTIQSIWREVLQIERVGAHDNFFDLGGHSLRLVVVHSKLAETLKRELSIVDLFQFPTISSLARHLANGDAGQPSLDQAQKRAQRQKDSVRRRAILATRRK
jgi:acyl carrier protein